MITEDYVSFETAKLLKEKGFDVPTEFVWYEHLPLQNAALEKDINKQKLDYFYLDKDTDRNSAFNNGEIPSYIMGGVYSAPTLQIAMKWLRNTFHLEIYPFHDAIQENNDWWYRVEHHSKGCGLTEHESDVIYKTYEQACEAAIKYCLENLV